MRLYRLVHSRRSIFIVDINTEDLAVMEANKLRIPTIAMVDTNSNPDLVDYVIPSNDDAIRAVKLIVSVIADAVEEGARIREVDMADIGQVSKATLAEQEQYLGPSTLAKLKATVQDFESFEGEEDGSAAGDEEEGEDYEEYEFEAEEEEDAFAAFQFGKEDEEEE